MKNRYKAPLAVAVVVALSGCGLLDVDNPNSLVEESVELEAAANGMVNGALQRVGEAIAGSWEPYLVASDELYWIGSRDAWKSLDNGFIADPENEFSDGRFPDMGQAVWTASNAVRLLEKHIAESPTPANFEKDYRRAQMFNGIILMMVGEIQEDMTFSNKQVDGPPKGAANMFEVLDDAITSLQAARGGFTALGEDELETISMALLARTQMSRAIWDEINPTATGTYAPAANFATAAATAALVLARADVSGDWQYTMDYSAATDECDMCSNINDRKENQLDLSLVTIDSSEDIDGIAMMDPVSGVADKALITRLNQWKGGSYLDSGDEYPSLTVTSARLMHLIIAEYELATNGGGPGSAFETSINNIRTLDSEVPFVSGGAVSDMDMLAHTRRMNLVLMGLRLADMYRWGLSDALWLPTGQTVTTPGTMLPVTLIEQRANCHYANPVPAGCGT